MQRFFLLNDCKRIEGALSALIPLRKRGIKPPQWTQAWGPFNGHYGTPFGGICKEKNFLELLFLFGSNLFRRLEVVSLVRTIKMGGLWKKFWPQEKIQAQQIANARWKLFFANYLRPNMGEIIIKQSEWSYKNKLQCLIRKRNFYIIEIMAWKEHGTKHKEPNEKFFSLQFFSFQMREKIVFLYNLL